MTLQYEQELYTLTSDFYNDYPNSSFPELLTPHGNRTYNCIIVEYKDYFICIPFRSHMRHQNGYHFRNTQRSRRVLSGLDYSKMVIIKNSSKYLSTNQALVDNDEYVEAVTNSERIISEATKYLDDYINHNKNIITLNSQEYIKKYSYSTLSYFHDILQIP
ncbi:type III toxin-antitoxin system TenpIN family toxin [Streptococcus suis]|uniref:type III toxin-antitoxin system TenpIN family toxin n=1 Tax=Streptococcus suis TaxID=1307 RepID=UPI0038B7D51F